MANKVWMVQGDWELPNGTVAPVRSVVEAKSRKAAEPKVEEAVTAAVKQLMQTDTPPGRMLRGHVLYAI